MSGRIILAVMLVATIAGCGRVSESRLNPLNWFGGSEKAEVVTAANPNADPRRLISQIVSLRVEQVPGGAIVRATGLPTNQGYFEGDLIFVSTDKGVLNYEFRATAPFTQTRVGTQQSREVVVGLFVSDQSLSGIRQIRVSGASNALVVRR